MLGTRRRRGTQPGSILTAKAPPALSAQPPTGGRQSCPLAASWSGCGRDDHEVRLHLRFATSGIDDAQRNSPGLLTQTPQVIGED